MTKPSKAALRSVDCRPYRVRASRRHLKIEPTTDLTIGRKLAPGEMERQTCCSGLASRPNSRTEDGALDASFDEGLISPAATSKTQRSEHPSGSSRASLTPAMTRLRSSGLRGSASTD